MHLRAILPILLFATTAQAQVMLDAPGRPAATLTAEQLHALPQAEATLGAGDRRHLQGPLLWTVLAAAHLVDPERHGDVVRQTIQLRGEDGYVAIIALGELSPEFEDKPVLLALTIDGKPLGHPRAYVPGDRRGGRGVHDVVGITLDERPKPARANAP